MLDLGLDDDEDRLGFEKVGRDRAAIGLEPASSSISDYLQVVVTMHSERDAHAIVSSQPSSARLLPSLATRSLPFNGTHSPPYRPLSCSTSMSSVSSIRAGAKAVPSRCEQDCVDVA